MINRRLTESDKDNVVSLIKSGKNAIQLAKIYSTDVSKIYWYLSKYSLSVDKLREEGFDEELTRVEAKKTNLFRVRQAFSLAPVTFYQKLANKGKLALFRNEREMSGLDLLDLREGLDNQGGIKEIDEGIKQGKSSYEIAEELGVERNYVNMYVLGSGQYRYRLAQKIKAELKSVPKINGNLNDILSNLLRTIIRPIVQRESVLPIEGNLETEVNRSLARHISSRKVSGLPKNYQLAAKVFQEYFKALESGEKIGYLDLAKRSGLNSPADARDVLISAGLNGMHGTLTRINDEEKELIERAGATKFNSRDILYFTNLLRNSKSILNHIGKVRKVDVPLRVGRGFGKGFDRGSYREASQIYEAYDQGFRTVEEINQLYPEIKPQIISKAIKERDEISSHIIEGLRMMYPQREINTPYLIN